jgi:hypothetical protein
MSTLTYTPSADLGLDDVRQRKTSRTPIRFWRPRRPGVNLLVLGIYSAISVIADLPVWPGDPSRVSTMLGEDIFQTAWFLEWTPYALLHGKNLFETNALNYPYGVDLAQNTGMPLLGLVTAPLTLLVNPIASENLLRFASFALSAYAAYWVLRKFVSWVPAAFVGGLLYGFSPYMLTQGSIHLNLMFVPLPPLILYGLFELLVTQRTHAVRRGVILGVALVAQYFISAEVLATTLLISAVATFLLVFSAFAGVRSRVSHALVGLGIAGVMLVAAAAYPTWVMFRGGAHYIGPAQGYASVFNADLWGAIFPTKFQLFSPGHFGAIGKSLVGGQMQENGSYLGVPLIFIVVVTVVRYWQKLWPIYLAMLIVASWLLSLGPRLIVDGHVTALPFDLPFRKLDHLPGVDNILPARFSLYVVWFIAILLALGLDEFHKNAAARRRLTPGAFARGGASLIARGRGAATVLMASATVLSVVTLLPAWPYVSYRVTINASERPKALAVIPTGSVVLTYPYPTTFFDAPMLWQANDRMRFKLVGGYALVPSKKGTATVFPERLEPAVVESMLVNSVSPVAVPNYPVAIAVSRTVHASSVVVDRDGVKGPHESKTTFRGVVIATVPKSHLIYIRHGYNPIGIEVGSATHYVERWAKVPSLAGVVPGELITVTGATGPGNITPRLVGQLREYLRAAHVQAVIVGLGTIDAGPVASWFRDALGPPTRAGGGAEIWTRVNVTDRNGA